MHAPMHQRVREVKQEEFVSSVNGGVVLCCIGEDIIMGVHVDRYSCTPDNSIGNHHNRCIQMTCFHRKRSQGNISCMQLH